MLGSIYKSYKSHRNIKEEHDNLPSIVLKVLQRITDTVDFSLVVCWFTMSPIPKILFVLTSHAEVEGTGEGTGW